MLPLHDVRIVAVEQYGAGPYGTLHLADMGADIIKIEHVEGGDVGRNVPPYRTGSDSLFFEAFNRSKRSVCLDITTGDGRSVLRDLVARSDGVFSNLRGDVPAKLGLRYEDLCDVNPAVTCCSLSGYGMTGPRAAHPGFDYMVQGLSGWMSLTGEPGGPPTKTGLSLVDFSAGYAAALALMIGIHAARRDGVGGDCDVALFDTALSLLNYLATWHLSTGYVPERTPQSSHPTVIPFGNFPTADGWIVVGGAKEKFWRQTAEAVGLGELADDPRFRTFDDRLAARRQIVELLNTAFRARTTAEWLRVLESSGVPCAAVNTVPEALAEGQAAAREVVFYQEHPTLGRVGHVASPVRVGTATRRTRGPLLGEHTLEVLTDLLGYDDRRVRELAAAGVVAGPGL